MGLETGTYVSDLVPSDPLSSDPVNQGDDHLRLVKNVLKNSLPNANRAQYYRRATAKTADYVIVATDMEQSFPVDATAGVVSLTLPTLATGNDGWCCEVVKVDSSANAITVVGTVNGETNITISKQYRVVRFLWTGTAWLAIFAVRFIAGTPTFDNLEVDGILNGTSTSHMVVAGGTTAQRPGSPAAKMVRYNTDLNVVEYYNGTSWAQLALASPRGSIDGCVLSNSTIDATNDIFLAAGICRDSTNTVDIQVSANVAGKQLDANWSASGTTNSGMRNSAAGIANGTYHIYAARTAAVATATIYAYAGVAGTDPDSAATVAAALAALQAESGGTSYIYARRIGSIVRSSAAIKPFTQRGNYFEWVTEVADFSATPPDLLAHLVSLTVPLGLILRAKLYIGSSNNIGVRITDPLQVDVAASASAFTASFGSSGGGMENNVWTDSSGRIRYRISVSGTLQINTFGYFDRRGMSNAAP